MQYVIILNFQRKKFINILILAGVLEQSKCGRPLGLAFDTIGDNLIVSDVYFGIWEVSLVSGKKTQLVSPNEVLPGDIPRPSKFFNSVTVAKNGDIYYTESTSDHTITHTTVVLLTNPSGRLFKYSRAEKKNYNLIDKLWFANGLALSPDESFIVVCETFASRIQKYHLKGAKAGTHEVFIEGLPGLVDNLTADADGIWVPLVVSADPENPMLAQQLTKLTYLRIFLIRLLWIIETPIQLIHNWYPNILTEKLLTEFGSTTQLMFIIPKRQSVVRLNWNGNVLTTLHADDASARLVTHVMEFGDYLYFGTPYFDYISRVKFLSKDLVHPKSKN